MKIFDQSRQHLLILAVLLLLPLISSSKTKKTSDIKHPKNTKTVSQLMQQLKKRVLSKKFHWDLSLFTDEGWSHKSHTVNGLPLIYWTCGDRESTNASLILSTVHGDEVTPVYFGFRLVEYLKARPELCKDKFVVVAPIVNPDGFLRYRNGTRSNYHKVDLNRNFDTPDWHKDALHLWKTKYAKRRRYYPGEKPASEPETKFQMWLIDEFKPVKIMSVHAPLNILDYDGPKTPEALKLSQKYFDSIQHLRETVKKATPELKFFAFGNFPGSLGNYAGKQRGIPTITAELPTTKASLAPYYFGMIEKGTRIFIEQEVKDSPIRASANSD